MFILEAESIGIKMLKKIALAVSILFSCSAHTAVKIKTDDELLDGLMLMSENYGCAYAGKYLAFLSESEVDTFTDLAKNYSSLLTQALSTAKKTQRTKDLENLIQSAESDMRLTVVKGIKKDMKEKNGLSSLLAEYRDQCLKVAVKNRMFFDSLGKTKELSPLMKKNQPD